MKVKKQFVVEIREYVHICVRKLLVILFTCCCHCKQQLFFHRMAQNTLWEFLLVQKHTHPCQFSVAQSIHSSVHAHTLYYRMSCCVFFFFFSYHSFFLFTRLCKNHILWEESLLGWSPFFHIDCKIRMLYSWFQVSDLCGYFLKGQWNLSSSENCFFAEPGQPSISIPLTVKNSRLGIICIDFCDIVERATTTIIVAKDDACICPFSGLSHLIFMLSGTYKWNVIFIVWHIWT